MLNRKKGFTLVELLGVIVILGLLLLLAFPQVMGQIQNTTKNIDSVTKDLIVSSSKNYIDKNQNEYPIIGTSVYCITLQTLIDSGYLVENLTKLKSGKKMDLSDVVKIKIENEHNIDYSIEKNNQCEEVHYSYTDGSGANKPALDVGMVPIIREGEKWIKANVYKKWYNYITSDWANVVLVKEASRNNYKNAAPGTEILEQDILAYLVWIPRYRYKLFNVSAGSSAKRTIEIEFETKKTAKSNGSTNGTWLTHPAFTFGSDELEGFWVGKFETTGYATAPTVKPYGPLFRTTDINDQFNTLKKFNNELNYGITSSFDAHMMKNMEWGAVAYLSHSLYGKNDEVWMNPSIMGLTGCAGNSASEPYPANCPYGYTFMNGPQASTTGNIYGIYDMSGGAFENVMGGMYGESGTSVMLGISEFDQATINGTAMQKYIDKYAYSTTSTTQSDYNRRKLGDATGETRGWYSDSAIFIAFDYPWFVRGGSYSENTKAGIFNFSYGSGVANACRLVISK